MRALWTVGGGRVLDLLDPADRCRAAEAMARGAAVGNGFGNFSVITARPDRASLTSVNRLKGRPDDQAGSVITTPDRLWGTFDWRQLPPALDPLQVIALMDALLALGPIGFRGPAAPQIPEHLSLPDGPVRTVQVVLPGLTCPSNLLVGRALAFVGGDLLLGTSANLSHRLTGRPEPAHHELSGMLADFPADMVMIGHRDEAAARARYPRHQPGSTSVVSFHRPVVENGRPAGGPGETRLARRHRDPESRRPATASGWCHRSGGTGLPVRSPGRSRRPAGVSVGFALLARGPAVVTSQP